MNGTIFDIQELTVHDGPGTRITIFLKGCPLRCLWCHNPEGQNIQQELMFNKNKCTNCLKCEVDGKKINYHLCPNNALIVKGYQMSVDDIVNLALKNKETLELLEGGITFSGGEPLFQPSFLLQCLKKLKEYNIHTAIETSGYCDKETFKQLLLYCDYIIMDIKLIDDEKHLTYTGKSNKKILENAKILMDSNVAHVFRTPLIKDITDTKENLKAIELFIKGHNWEKIPSNPLAAVKYQQLGRTFYLEN